MHLVIFEHKQQSHVHTSHHVTQRCPVIQAGVWPTQIVRRTNKSCSVLTICAWRPLLSLGGVARPWTPAFDAIAVESDPMLTLYLLSAIALNSDGHEVWTARPRGARSPSRHDGHAEPLCSHQSSTGLAPAKLQAKQGCRTPLPSSCSLYTQPCMHFPDGM